MLQQEGDIDFYWHAKLLELNFFMRKDFSPDASWSNRAGKIVLTDGQFACCLALNTSPGLNLWPGPGGTGV